MEMEEEEYDRRFEYMKSYIPFLEGMIKKLESLPSSESKPRHAQLSKIKSLRLLLLEKTKRMKMDNLLKCEQVLINLYAKVEHKDDFVGIQPPLERPKDFESARQKLKVLSKQTASEDGQDTLPEIARADQIDVVCTPGSKEPALFQRRPNKLSPSSSSSKEEHSTPKRNYTRVLVSPEPRPRQSSTETKERDKKMYQRRSPRSPRKPKRGSDKDPKRSRDLNILLKVPEKSLKDLNTENMVERIMDCDDKDVNIDCLREIRAQILHELKKSGSNDDISDIIMKSYKKKDLLKKKPPGKALEVEDGEISDSESEIIDNVYGNLVIVNDKKGRNDKGVDVSKTDNECDTRKIQISFVLGDTSASTANVIDVSNLEKSDDPKTVEPNPNNFEVASKSEALQESIKESSPEPNLTIDLFNHTEDIQKEVTQREIESSNYTTTSAPLSTAIDILNISKAKIHLNIPKIIEPRKANFYTPVTEYDELNDENNAFTVEDSTKNTSEKDEIVPVSVEAHSDPLKSPEKALPLANDIISLALEKIVGNVSPVKATNVSPKANNIKNEVETKNKSLSLKIPFISDVSEKIEPPKVNVVSELDILQALKNDILSEPINLPNTETPSLHQPKLTKVTNVKEITKKKITLDKYKQKSLSSTSSVKKHAHDTLMSAQKQSRGLTEKECERFMLPCRLSLDNEYSSEDEPSDKRSPSPTDAIYGDLAPQSPDAQSHTNESPNAPVIIPAEPLKPTVVASINDIDMRTLPIPNKAPIKPNVIKEVSLAASEKNSPRPYDPRLRKDAIVKANEKISSPNLMVSGTASLPAPLPVPSPFSASSSPFPNMTPSRTPNSRAFEIGTPSHQTFDLSDSDRSKKHVYAPAFASYDTSEVRESSIIKESCTNINVWERNDKNDPLKRDDSKTSRSRWEDSRNIRRDEDMRYERSSHRDHYKERHTRPNYERNDYRDNYPTTPIHSFGRSDAPMTPLPSFGRSEAPRTPLPSFGRTEASTTPMPSFGRSDMTPLPSFGRSECPTTPSHPFGRSDIPRTPSHPFGRSDYAPNTPTHPFGRSEYQRSSSNSYGKSQDNRVRRSDYDSNLRDRNAPNHNRNYGNEKFSYSRNDQFDKRDVYSQSESPERSIGRNFTREEYVRDAIGSQESKGDYHHNRFGDYRHRSNRPDYRYENDGNKYQHESRRQQYEKSHRPLFEQTNARGFSRRHSVGRYEQKQPENTVSVEADAGRSFTIDTSVNATFQGFDKSILNNTSFDARRQRAASVGRMFVKESSVGRSFLKETNVQRSFERGSSVGRSFNAIQENTFQKGQGRALAEAFVPSFDKHFYTNKPISKFTRAQSVGRDLAQVSTKTFAETKAEFQSYKNTSFERHSKESTLKVNRSKEFKKDSKSRNAVISDKYLRRDKNEPYSPRKNLRDPRLQQRHQDNYHVDHRPSRNPRDRAYGIVYSNDNIAKGNVIGPGVKNYKIPKLKKPIEEDSDTSKSDNLKSSDSETTKTKNKEPSKNHSDRIGGKSTVASVEEKMKKDGIINSCKVASSLSNSKQPKNDNGEDDEIFRLKSRSTQKKVVYSDSDEEIVAKNKNVESAKKTKGQDSKTTDNYDKSDNISLDFDNDVSLDAFTDNIASENVMDQIDNLIADLDKDIGNKIEGDLVTHITKDDVFDSLFENLDKIKSGSPETAETENSIPVASFSDDTKEEDSNVKNTQNSSQNPIINADEIQSKSPQVTLAKPQEKNIKDSQKITLGSPLKSVPTLPQRATPDSPQKTTAASPNALRSPMRKQKSPIIYATKDITDNEINNEAEVADGPPVALQIRSNSDTSAETELEKTSAYDNQENNDGINSTPDSTIENDELNSKKCEGQDPEAEAIPQPENMNPDVSSTHDSSDQSAEKSIGATSTKNKDISSINSIISLLQDKNRIKELLSLIGNEQEGEKLKKKLEKLSEIVSDDDDDKIITTPNQVKETSKNNDKPEEEQIEQKKSDDALLEQKKSEDQLIKDKKSEDVLIKQKNSEDALIEQKKSEDLEEATDAIPQSDTSSENINDQPTDDSDVPIAKVNKKPGIKKTQVKRKGIGKRKKKQVVPKQAPKRITRAGAANKPKKASRELKNLHDDIRDMFMSDEVLNATGIRMCRLAKMSEEPSSLTEQDSDLIKTKDKPSTKKGELLNNTNKPLVVIEKMPVQEPDITKPPRKKPGPKPKLKPPPKPVETIKPPPRRKPGPKSKTKIPDNQQNDDPYDFESDTMSEATIKASENSAPNTSSDSENDSLASSSTSIGSSELLIELKTKQKRRRGGWQSGVIRRTKKKAPIASEKPEEPDPNLSLPPALIETPQKIPDYDCFTDVRYSFEKNHTSYPCRLCNHEGENIVSHYKNNHPHYEIPLSRLKQNVAKEAIKQSMVTNFQKICNVPLQKYVCRFCNIVLDDKRKPLLETFFWHVVSNHTGEYKQLCSECRNTKSCTFMLDIPPPPKNLQGLLMGYICGKCFYTQVSLENLKNHVSLRHNDEETEVYTISLATITQQMVETMKNSATEEAPRTLRNSKQFAPSDSKENSDNDEIAENSRPLSVQSKLSFENENDGSLIKDEAESENEESIQAPPNKTHEDTRTNLIPNEAVSTNDIFEHAHLKINFSSTGAKEYICAATGGDDHYKTTLLISIKQHVQKSHANQKWDGYCYFCKVIVMPQGSHSYKDCLAHFLDKHLEDGIVKDKPPEQETPENPIEKEPEPPKAPTPPPKSYLSVKPMSQLLPTAPTNTAALDNVLPKIQSVMSLNSEVLDEPTIPLPVSVNEPVPYTEVVQKDVARKPMLEYEESLKQVMSNKYRIALDTMLTNEKLSHVFKCPSRYCSFTCDSAEDALIHCSTHLRMGSTDALRCSYCSFDCSGDYIELVSHVFKDHGNCKYSCTSCFYRGRTLSMVENHCQTAHVATRKCAVVSSVVVAPIQSVVLTRKEAVKTYSCVYGVGTENPCYFKTATPDKYCSHLSTDHPDLTAYRCSECPVSASSLPMLIEHLSQQHQLKSFQCSWCVFGAETRLEILTHCSTKHPIEMPQAYWRKIITKDGAPPKVLPLVSLSGSALFNAVEPLPTPRSDPVREAERADALDKLVGVTSQVTETAPENDFDLAEDSHDADDMVSPEEEPLDLPLEEPVTFAAAAATEANPTVSPTDTSVADRATPILKKEPLDETDVKPLTSVHIISLDSDDEDANQLEPENVIELSDSDGESAVLRKAKRVNGPRLRACDVYACKKCKNLFKNAAGLKRHVIYCYGSGEQFDCAHCTDVFMCTNTLVKHLKFVHGPEEKYVCGICFVQETEATKMRNHLSLAHKVTKFIVNMIVSDDSLTITNTFKPESSLAPLPSKRATKRKRSSTTQATTPPKVKKFSPEEIDTLPIAPIFEGNAFCSLCEFNTKVRVNMVRHLQAHAQKQPDLPEIAPVNPVPHLESNEMHFDRMVNLASSSITTRAPEQSSRAEQTPIITIHVPPSIAARYPKYVPERKRYTCGAKNCSYISIDEAMLNCHWETLHSGSNDYHCVHCPSNQHLDTSRALTASRIIAHLKMHDMRLYCCSECTYYHNLRHLVEKHINDKHTTGGVKIVREPMTGPVASTSVAPTPGRTMDLKPWQCGLCKFNDMLRPKVVEHCSRYHNSKFQFKCMFCPWRSSAKENVVKHHMTAHQQQSSEVFYFYYQEGSLPEINGKPVWVIQKENSNTPDVKEDPEPVPEVAAPTENIEVNVDLVKKEPVDKEDMNPESLCKKYGALCDPNGLLYNCPFCKVAAENNKVSMQSHLFEELKYRRWACNICSYKAFHKQGLKDHAASEHKGMLENSTELPQNIGIETWVAMLLKHQDEKIAENQAKVNSMAAPVQKNPTVQPEVSSLNASKINEESKSDFTNQELEKAFGSFGAPVNMMFHCPKCEFKTKDEPKMSEHLEMELTRIRWCCNLCTEKFTQYHLAQLHCRTAHAGGAARPLEALRDPAARRAWPLAVIAVQKLSMNVMPFTAELNVAGEPEIYTAPVNNDLLVVRYEENVPDPDQPMTIERPSESVKVTSEPVLGKRKRPGFLGELDSDDEKLIIDDRPSKKLNPIKRTDAANKCPHCVYFTRSAFVLNAHILAHYDLKPFACLHCNFTNQKSRVIEHCHTVHPDKPQTILKTIIPSYPPKRQELAVRNPRGPVKKQSVAAPAQKDVDIELKKASVVNKEASVSNVASVSNMASVSNITSVSNTASVSNIASVTNIASVPNTVSVSNTKEKVFICLICEQEVLGTATRNHIHTNQAPQYAKKGDLILKCTTCSVLKNNLPAMKLHHTSTHPQKNLDYVYTKLLSGNTGGVICKVTGCGRKFAFMEDLKTHYQENHAKDSLSFTITPSTSNTDDPISEDIQEEPTESGEKRKSTNELCVVAKKSTTKLPFSSKIAKKSTTKLPMLFIEDSAEDSAEEGFSFYGSKPAPLEQYSNVKTHMPFMNTVMPFTVNKLKDIVDITPKIVVKRVPEPDS